MNTYTTNEKLIKHEESFKIKKMDRNQNMSKNKHENQEKSLRQGHWWNTEWKEWRHVFMYTNRNKYKKEFLTFKFIFTLYAWVLNISSEAGLAKDLLKMMGYDGIYEVQNWILTHKLFDFSCCILFICHILMWYIRYIYRMNKYIHISFGQSVSQSHSHSVTQPLLFIHLQKVKRSCQSRVILNPFFCQVHLWWIFWWRSSTEHRCSTQWVTDSCTASDCCVIEFWILNCSFRIRSIQSFSC